MRPQRSPAAHTVAAGRSNAASAHARRLDTPVTPAPATDRARSDMPAPSPNQRSVTPQRSRSPLLKDRPPFTLAARAPTAPPAAWTPFKHSPRPAAASTPRSTPRTTAAPFTPSRSPLHTRTAGGAPTTVAKAIPATPQARWEQAMRETRRETRPTNAATPLGLARSAAAISGSPLASPSSSSRNIVRVQHSDIASLLQTLQRLDPSGDHKFVQQLASRLMKDNAAASHSGSKHLSFRLREPVDSFVTAVHSGRLFASADAAEEEVPFSQTQRRPVETSPLAAKLHPSMDTIEADDDGEEEVAFSQTQARLSFRQAEEEKQPDAAAEEDFVPATQHTPPQLATSFASMQLQSRSPNASAAKRADNAHTLSPAAAERGFVNPFATSPQLAAGLLAALEAQPQPSLRLRPSQAMQSPPPPPLSQDHFDSDEPVEPLRPASLSLQFKPSMTPAAAISAATPRSILKHHTAASAAHLTPSLSLNFEEAADDDGPSPQPHDHASPLRPGSANDDRKHVSAHSPAVASRASSKEWSLAHPPAAAAAAVVAAVAAAPPDASSLANASVNDSQGQAAAALIEAMLPLDFNSLRPLSELQPDDDQQRDSDDDDEDGGAPSKEERVQFDLSGLSRQHSEERDHASDEDRTHRSRQRARSAGELQPPTIGAPGSTQLTPRGADTPLDSRRSSRRASHARTPSWARSVARSSPPQSEAQSDDDQDESSQQHSNCATPPLTQLSPAHAAISLPHTQLHSALRSTFMESQLEYDAMSQAVFGGHRRDDEEAREVGDEGSVQLQADDAVGVEQAEPFDEPPLQSNHAALYDPPSQSRTVVAADPPPAAAIAPASPPRFSEYDLVADDPVSEQSVVSDRSVDVEWRSKKAVVTREAELDSIQAAQLTAAADAASAPAVSRIKSFQKAALVRNASLTGFDRSNDSSSSAAAVVAAAVTLPVWKKSKAQIGSGSGLDASASSSASASAAAPVRRSDRRSGIVASAVAAVTDVLPPPKPKPKRAPRADPPPIIDPLVPASAISQPKVDARRQSSRILPLQLTNYLRAPTSIRGAPQQPASLPVSSKARRSSPVDSIDLCSPDPSSANSDDGVW